MNVRLHVRRFFRDAASCKRTIFTERLPGVVAHYARQTKRLDELFTHVSFALGGEAGARLLGGQREKEYQERSSVKQLTPREKEILRCLAEGLNDRQIAQRLHISFETERNHMTSIFAKLAVRSRLQAILFAIRRGIVKVPSRCLRSVDSLPACTTRRHQECLASSG